MVYIATKTIHGHKYRYEVTEINIGGKRIRTSKYLEPVEPIYNKRKAPDTENTKITPSSKHADTIHVISNSAGNVKGETDE